MTPVSRALLLGALALLLSSGAGAQEPKSAPLAKQLAMALDASQRESIAAKDPSGPDTYVGALYVPGLELLVVAGKYAAPLLLDERLKKKEYRDTYMDLNGAATAGTKVFVEDVGADGLSAKRDGSRIDSFEAAGKRTTFDGDWEKQKLTEEEYLKIYASADDRYAKMLTALLAQLKKAS
jgi:hypothetical protein